MTTDKSREKVRTGCTEIERKKIKSPRERFVSGLRELQPKLFIVIHYLAYVGG